MGKHTIINNSDSAPLTPDNNSANTDKYLSSDKRVLFYRLAQALATIAVTYGLINISNKESWLLVAYALINLFSATMSKANTPKMLGGNDES